IGVVFHEKNYFICHDSRSPGPRIHQRKVRCGPPLNGTFRPNAAAVSVNDPLDSRQSHTCSREVGLVMKTLEGAEKPIRIGRVESGAVVSNVVGESAVALRPAKLDTSRLTLRGKFPRIAKQVLKRDSDQMGIDERPEVFFNPELSSALRLRFLQLFGNGPGDQTQVRLFQSHLGAAPSRNA